jgi:hypothetical protein
LTKPEFFQLADRIRDGESGSATIRNFETTIEQNPEWLEEWCAATDELREGLGAPAPPMNPQFESSLTARWRAEQVRRNVEFWAPAALSAVAAAVGLFVILQVLALPAATTRFDQPKVEAKLDANQVAIPELNETVIK